MNKAGNRFKHGATRNGGSKVYHAWKAIHERCKRHPRYAGRGIAVCEHWESFENFYADVGDPPTPKHSIDRYPNNDGNYEPGNVRWATSKEQANNRRRRKVFGKPPTGYGEKNPFAKLTWDAVDKIRAMRRSGETLAAIGKLFGICETNVSSICSGKTWTKAA